MSQTHESDQKLEHEVSALRERIAQLEQTRDILDTLLDELKETENRVLARTRGLKESQGRIRERTASLKEAELLLVKRTGELEDSERRLAERTQDLESTEQQLRTRGEDLRKAFASLRAEVARNRETLEKLGESEAKSRALVETALQGILVADEDGRITLANPALGQMFGYRREELLGENVELLIPERFREAHRSHRSLWLASPVNRPMGAGLELIGRKKDGTELPVEIGLSHFVTREGTFAVAFVNDATERKRQEKALQSLTARLLSAEEAERRRLARALHDDLSQDLSLLVMDVQRVIDRHRPPGGRERRSVAEPPTGAERRRGPAIELREVVESRVEELSGQIREISHRLHPARLEYLGLERALRSECDAFSTLEEIPVELNVEDLPESVPPEASLCIYRIAQEALRNAAKHANPSRIEVRLAGAGGGIELTVHDRGGGFDVQHSAYGGGLGLVGMQERARLAKGRFEIDSRPGEGTRVHAWIPLIAESGSGDGTE